MSGFIAGKCVRQWAGCFLNQWCITISSC